MTAAGHLLRELSMVERTQPTPLFTGLRFGAETATVGFAGGEAVLALDSTRGQIVQALRNWGLDALDPFDGEPQTIPGDPDSHEVWCELLDDLGAHSWHLGHIDSRLTYLEVHRDGALARILVGNGLRSMSLEVELDGGEMPAALPVDIAGDFAAGG